MCSYNIQALTQLHQIEVLGSRLTVEYAKPYHEHLAARQCTRWVSIKIKMVNFKPGNDLE